MCKVTRLINSNLTCFNLLICLVASHLSLFIFFTFVDNSPFKHKSCSFDESFIRNNSLRLDYSYEMNMYNKNVNKNFNDSLIVYFHSPKTGGTTILKYLEKNKNKYNINIILNYKESYLNMDRLLRKIKKTHVNLIYGHRSTFDFYNKTKQHFENVSFIVHLRNPLDRVYSAYFYSKSMIKKKKNDLKLSNPIQTYENILNYPQNVYYFCESYNFSINSLNINSKQISKKNINTNNKRYLINYEKVKSINNLVKREESYYSKLCSR